MTDLDRTLALLRDAGLPLDLLDQRTITYHLMRGKSPAWIAHEIYSVPRPAVTQIEQVTR